MCRRARSGRGRLRFSRPDPLVSIREWCIRDPAAAHVRPLPRSSQLAHRIRWCSTLVAALAVRRMLCRRNASSVRLCATASVLLRPGLCAMVSSHVQEFICDLVGSRSRVSGQPRGFCEASAVRVPVVPVAVVRYSTPERVLGQNYRDKRFISQRDAVGDRAPAPQRAHHAERP